MLVCLGGVGAFACGRLFLFRGRLLWGGGRGWCRGPLLGHRLCRRRVAWLYFDLVYLYCLFVCCGFFGCGWWLMAILPLLLLSNDFVSEILTSVNNILYAQIGLALFIRDGISCAPLAK